MHALIALVAVLHQEAHAFGMHLIDSELIYQLSTDKNPHDVILLALLEELTIDGYGLGFRLLHG